MRRLLIRCYPARWRARYGDEFEAILEERPLGPFDVADIFLGALDARLRSRWHRAPNYERGSIMSLRIGGIAAIAGAAIWTIFLMLIANGAGVANGGGQPFGGDVAIVTFAGLLALLVAVAGLSAFQARAHPTLVWMAFAITAAGTVAILIGAAAELLPVGAGDWNQVLVVFGALAAVLGSALFGVATYRNSASLRGAAALLVAGPVIGASAFIVALVAVDLAYLLMMPATICFLAGWFALGVQAVRLDGAPAAARPA